MGDIEEQDDGSVEEDVEVEVALDDSPHSRMVGGTEYSWCKAVSRGTGITVLALLFDADKVVPSLLQPALDHIQAIHPRLRSRLLWIHGRPALSVSPVPLVKLQVVHAHDFLQAHEPDPREDSQGDEWLRLVETELNINSEWREQHHCLEPKPMMALRLYVDIHPSPAQPECCSSRSLLVFRLHTAICDRASAATVLTELLHTMCRLRSASATCNSNDNTSTNDPSTFAGEDLSPLNDPSTFAEEYLSPSRHLLPQEKEAAGISLVAIEDAIPKGMADKPFWAHGVDILGYSLGSRRHAMLPFLNVEQLERRSETTCLKLSVGDTQKLFKECSVQRTNRLGALTAAGLKATAILKKLGSRSEHYAVVTLLDCRPLLEPVLSKSTVGFYHSAILNTHQVSEGVDFWELARRCSGAVEGAVSRRKHFRDMGDVGLLMCQAMQTPQLTPFASMRTSTLVIFEEAMVDELAADARREVGLLEYIGCSSVHGVGPSIAIFDTLRQGALHCTCVYPSPLHSRTQITHLLHTMMRILVNAA